MTSCFPASVLSSLLDPGTSQARWYPRQHIKRINICFDSIMCNLFCSAPGCISSVCYLFIKICRSYTQLYSTRQVSIKSHRLLRQGRTQPINKSIVTSFSPQILKKFKLLCKTRGCFKMILDHSSTDTLHSDGKFDLKTSC